MPQTHLIDTQTQEPVLQGAGVPAPWRLFACQGAGLTLPETLPEWVELVPAGECLTRDGRGPFLLSDPAAVVADFSADYPPGSDQAALVDYDHADLKRTPGADLPPAAGWLAELRVSAAGGIEGRIDWTDRARAHIAAREYRYLSPELLVDPASNTIVGLSGAGLTHRPNLYLRALSHRVTAPLLDPLPEPQTMDDDLLERLRYLFNLPTLAGPAEIVAQLDLLRTRLESARSAEMVPATATPADSLALMHDLGRAVATLRVTCQADTASPPAQVLAMAQQRITELEDRIAERTAAEAVATALRERLIEPAKQAWARGYARQDPQGFATYLQGCTPIVLSRDPAAPPVSDPAGGDFEALVTRAMKTEQVSRATAMMQVARTHPDAHRAWIDSTQPHALSA